MKRILFLISLMSCMSLYAQITNQDDFKIGIEAGAFAKDDQNKIISSDLDVLAEDGFNLIYSYGPDPATSDALYSKNDLKNFILYAGSKKMKVILTLTRWFIPLKDLDYSTNDGVVNIKDRNFNNPNSYYCNYESLFNEVLNNPKYSSFVYGTCVASESEDIMEIDPLSSPRCLSAIPPARVFEAIGEFNKIKLPSHKIFQNQGTHGNFIVDGKVATPEIDKVIYPSYAVSDYLKGGNAGDIHIEHSYFHVQFAYYLNGERKYLGKFANLEFQKKYFKTVLSEVYASTRYHQRYGRPESPEFMGLDYILSTNKAIENFNQTWFQAYTSIIHGAKGIYFWGLGPLMDGSNEELIRYSKFKAGNFAIENFPIKYQKGIRFLANELAFLKEKGVLTGDDKNVLYSRTINFDNPMQDLNHIVPACSTYIPKYLNYTNSRDLFDITNNPDWPYYRWNVSENKDNSNNYTNESYGVQYTIRTNGKEAYMIVSNPNPVSFTVDLDFSGILNPLIKEASEVEVLFEDGLLSANDLNYKTDRNTVDWKSGVVKKSYKIPFSSKKISLAFGPLDVHVIRFNRPSLENDWSNVWGNGGQNNIGGWGFGKFDKIYPGDFDGDGIEEVLCVQHFDNEGQYAGISKFYNSTWNWDWDNSGNDKIGDWKLKASDRIIVGNFEGTGDELLIIEGRDYGMASLYRFNKSSNSWTKRWSNGTYGSIGLWNIRTSDKYLVGKFNNTSGRDELLSIQGIDFPSNLVQMHSFNGSVWTNIYSNGGSNMLSDWTIRVGDSFLVGDFNGDNRSELLCNNTSLNARLKMYSFSSGLWSAPLWTEPIGHGIAPYKNNMNVCDFDGDGRDNIFGNSNTGWVTTFYYGNNNDFNWGWSSSSDYYLDDFYIPDGTYSTKYIPINAKTKSVSDILVIRKYSESDHFASMFSYTPNSYNILGSVTQNMKKIYKIYVPNKSLISATTCFDATQFDTFLEIKNEDGSYACANCYNNDITCSTCNPQNRASKISNVILEEGYYNIEVSGLAQASGNFRLDVFRESIYEVPFVVYGNTKNKQNRWNNINNQINMVSDMSYLVHLPVSMDLNASLCNDYTNFDTQLEIFNFNKTSTGAWNNNGCGIKSLVNKSLTPGYYYFVIDGYNNNSTGKFQMNVSAQGLSTKSAVIDSLFSASLVFDDPSLGIVIYPNPTDGRFFIKQPSSDDHLKTLNIYNHSGQVVMSLNLRDSDCELDISSLSDGVYFLKFLDKEHSKVYKIIKKSRK